MNVLGTKTKALGSRQKVILEFIEGYSKQNGYPPTVREIGEGTGLASSSTVHGHLNALEKKRYIRRDPIKPRALELLKPEERRLVVSDITEDERNKLFFELVKRGFSVEVQ